MPRWEPDAIGRLQQAAIELFEQNGVDRTTVADIAQRANLTERTFFNHFPAKTDVLFGPRTNLHLEVVTRELNASIDTASALDAVVHALQVAADELLQGLREASIRRRKIIQANPALMERQEGKRAALVAAVATTLQDCGLDPATSLLTARAGALVQDIAEENWTQSTAPRLLRDVLADALAALRAVVKDEPIEAAHPKTSSKASPGGELRPIAPPQL